MSDLIRDAPIGQLIRYITGNKYLQYPEERPDYQCPGCYASPDHEKHIDTPLTPTSRLHSITSEVKEQELSKANSPEAGREPRELDFFSADLIKDELEQKHDPLHLARTLTDRSHDAVSTSHAGNSDIGRVSSRVALENSHTRADLEAALSAAITFDKQPTRPIVPEKTSDGTTLVTWYTTDDPANPQNWSFAKKAFVSAQIYLYTLAVYSGSAIYAPSEGGIMEQFGVSATAASLGLALYVLAYGIGPLLFSPLSEIPSIGRNPPYLFSFAIFVILCVPASLVNSFSGLLVLRFLQGFFGSPCLATGGASLQDIFSLVKVPYAIMLWAFAATCGPALGPIISGFSVAAENWHWSMWEMLWMAGPVWLLMFAFMPETSSSNILLRRAQRLRKINPEGHLASQSEIDQAALNAKDIVKEALLRPVLLFALDPVIAYTDIYIALCYGIFYSFFEAFPLVYVESYGFNLGEMGLAFLAVAVGATLTMVGYGLYIYLVIEPGIRAHGFGAPERRLIPALFITPLIPIGLFIFAWTTSGSIHWIVSCIGVAIFIIGLFTLFQCIFVYLPFTYPQYAASLFAGNDFARSILAAAAILFARPLFLNLGVGPGVSLLAALTAFMVIGIYVLFFYGDKLRARSKFSAK